MPSIFNLFRKRLGRALGLGLLAFLVLAVPISLDLGRSLENFALDFCYRLRPQEPPPKEILIVGIDAASFRELKEPWPRKPDMADNPGKPDSRSPGDHAQGRKTGGDRVINKVFRYCVHPC